MREDYRIASIVQTLINVNRGKGQSPIKLEECLVQFGEQAEKPKQTWQQQLALVKILSAMHANDTPEHVAAIEAAEAAELEKARKAMN